MSGVSVANVKASALPRQTTGTHTREAALVGELGVAVDFVHQLRKLGAGEELLDRGHHRAGVEQLRRGDFFGVSH